VVARIGGTTSVSIHLNAHLIEMKRSIDPQEEGDLEREKAL